MRTMTFILSMLISGSLIGFSAIDSSPALDYSTEVQATIIKYNP